MRRAPTLPLIFILKSSVYKAVVMKLKNGIGNEKLSENTPSLDELKAKLVDTDLIGVRFGDTKGNIIYVNDEMLRMMGYTRSDFEADQVNWVKSLAPADRIQHDEWIKKLLDEGRVHGYEKRFLRPDGRFTPYIGAAALVTPGSDFHVSVAIDLSQVKLSATRMRLLNEYLKNEIKRQTKKLESQTKRLRQLADKLLRSERDERNHLSSILHDHIQPLIVGARMQVWEIQRKKDPVATENIAGRIEEILSQALKALRSLSVELSPSALQNNGLIGGLNWIKIYMKTQFEFTVSLSMPFDIEPIKDEIAFLLFEATKEMLLNVVKHADIDEATLSIRRTEQDLIVLTVTDRGKGFDSKLIDGQSFETVTLGLFTIQERLNSLNGEMLVETEPGKGTQITLTVPAGKKRKKKKSHTIDKNLEKCNKNKIGRFYSKEGVIGILIVDDHKLLREGLKSLLQAESDFHILGEADSGEQAVEMVIELEPDVVIMDVNLGDMSGIKATQHILTHHPETRVIALSMHDDQGVIDAMYRAGAVGYLTKNEPMDKILEMIRKSLTS